MFVLQVESCTESAEEIGFGGTQSHSLHVQDGGLVLKVYVEKVVNLAPHGSQDNHNQVYQHCFPDLWTQVIISKERKAKKKHTPKDTKPLKKSEQLLQVARSLRG